MTQVTYNSEALHRKRVWYAGTDRLLAGYCLCYDRDYGTATAGNAGRAYRVEKPAADGSNLRYFAGVVAEGDAGKTGPCWVTIVEPAAGAGRLAPVHTDQDCTLGVTRLAVVAGSYAAGPPAADAVPIATAMQTVDCSEAPGAVLAQLEGVGPGLDAAAAVVPTQDDLTDSSGGTAATTLAAITQAANAGSADVGPTADAVASLAAQLAKVKADLAAVITALQNANLMA